MHRSALGSARGQLGAARTICSQLVLKAYIKCRIRMRCESHPCLSNDIFRPSVFIPHCILDLNEPGRLANLACSCGVSSILTCILTICPSPFCPSTIAVTRTRVSLPTKFRIHLSYLLLWPVCAARSNLSARLKGRTMRSRRAVDRRENLAMTAFTELELLRSVRRVPSVAVWGTKFWHQQLGVSADLP